MQRAQRYNAAANKHQQATPRVCDTPICAVLLCVVFMGACVRSVLPFFAAVCDRSTLTLAGNVRIDWIEYEYLNGINISDVLCVLFPETHPRNVDIRQHAENANNIATPPSSTGSSGPHYERVAGPHCTAVASCSIGGCDPSSVITASLPLLLCCACCVMRATCRASGARREKKEY